MIPQFVRMCDVMRDVMCGISLLKRKEKLPGFSFWD